MFQKDFHTTFCKYKIPWTNRIEERFPFFTDSFFANSNSFDWFAIRIPFHSKPVNHKLIKDNRLSIRRSHVVTLDLL